MNKLIYITLSSCCVIGCNDDSNVTRTLTSRIEGEKMVSIQFYSHEHSLKKTYYLSTGKKAKTVITIDLVSSKAIELSVGNMKSRYSSEFKLYEEPNFWIKLPEVIKDDKTLIYKNKSKKVFLVVEE